MKRLSLLLVAATVGALLLAATVSAAQRTAPRERVKLTLVDASQQNAAARGYLRIVVRGTRAGRPVTLRDTRTYRTCAKKPRS